MSWFHEDIGCIAICPYPMPTIPMTEKAFVEKNRNSIEALLHLFLIPLLFESLSWIVPSLEKRGEEPRTLD